jgi:hypothetical protein
MHTNTRDTKNTVVLAKVYNPASPSVQLSAGRGSESSPGGYHKFFWQIAVSKNRNLDPSAKNEAMRDGRTSPGQKRDAGSGDTTKSHTIT